MESRRMTSIARRINRHFVWRLFWVLFWVDVLLIALSLGLWVMQTEQNNLGSVLNTAIGRRVLWDDQGGSFFSTLGTVQYLLTPAHGDVLTIQAGVFLQSLYRLVLILGIIEVFILFSHFFSNRKQTAHILFPLTRMAETAEQLSQAPFDEQKFHDLENAIEALSATAPDARLHTGDRELLGLETAVNNLLGRMHDSYRQQIRFVSDASHELRTPISVIQGYADMLARWGTQDEKVLKESITAIRDESQHMQKIVEQLLFLARGDAGRNQLTMAKVDLADMMRDVHEEYDMINPAHRWQLQAEEHVLALGDLAMLKQTARILADNAAKYSREGEAITLRAFYTDKGQPCISVQDNGNGIQSKDIPHIFERFYRSDPARTRNTGGTGLGLSIAKWIVDRHEGYFNVISREGLGTRIEVVLPKFKEEATPGSDNVIALEVAKGPEALAAGK